jgi:hypothetical protein
LLTFKSQLSKIDNAEMINKVNTFKPEVLFVKTTDHKQKKLAKTNQLKLDAR